MQEKRRYSVAAFSNYEPYPYPSPPSLPPIEEKVSEQRRFSDAIQKTKKKKFAYQFSPDANGNYVCTDCNKVYKHPYCLAKHRWEHSDNWDEVSKLKLSKHQTVQIMEAAQILMDMGEEGNE